MTGGQEHGLGSPGPVVLVWSRASALGHCHLGAQWPLLRGFGKRATRQRVFWESCCISAGEDAGGTSLAAQHHHWFCYSLGRHLCQWVSFFGRAIGEIGPLPTNCVGFFPFIIYFNYYLRGLDSLALILAPLLFICPKSGLKRKKMSAMLLGLLAKIKCKGVILCLQLEWDNLLTIVFISNFRDL